MDAIRQIIVLRTLLMCTSELQTTLPYSIRISQDVSYDSLYWNVCVFVVIYVLSLCLICFSIPVARIDWLLRWNVEILSELRTIVHLAILIDIRTKLYLFTSHPVTLCCFWLTCLNTCVDRSSISIAIAVSMPGHEQVIHTKVVCTHKPIAISCQFNPLEFISILSKTVSFVCFMWCNNQSNKQKCLITTNGFWAPATIHVMTFFSTLRFYSHQYDGVNAETIGNGIFVLKISFKNYIQAIFDNHNYVSTCAECLQTSSWALWRFF